MLNLLTRLAPLLAILSIVIKQAAAVGGICAQIVHGNFYDLGKLKSDDDYVLDVANLNGKIYFNLCSFARAKCPGTANAYAIFKTEDRCIPLTTNNIASGYNSSLIRYSNGSTGLNISFEGVTLYDGPDATANKTYKVEFDLRCVSGMAAYRWDDPSPVFFSENATIVVTGEGEANCPKYSGSYLVDFLNKFSFINALFAILAGVFQAFYGYKLYRPTIFLIGFLFGFIFVGLFLFAVWTSQDSGSFKGYIIFFLALVAGVGVGFIVITFSWVGLVISGSILGFFVAMILYTLIFFRIISYPPNLLFYNILLIGMVGGAISGYEYQDIILILSCGISGAYLTVRGLSVFFGGFPNEFELATKFKTGQDAGVGGAFYFYMLLIFAMAAGGIYYQMRLKRVDMEKEAGDEYLVGLAAKEDN
jgi:hypothetical protein